jgi:hypothetical protein
MVADPQSIPKPSLISLARGIIDDAKQLAIHQFELRKYQTLQQVAKAKVAPPKPPETKPTEPVKPPEPTEINACRTLCESSNCCFRKRSNSPFDAPEDGV